MGPLNEERRLTTILAADVVGYSRLMGEDEAGTLAALKAHRRELVDPKVEQYHGRVVKLMGDGALIEFSSVIDAVKFAVEIQAAMPGRTSELPESRRIRYRIGINIGDIIVDDDDIFGDGVNIAARMEGLAEPGEICISRNVFSQVEGKLDLNFDALGEKNVKNIAKPVSVYRIVIDETAARLKTPVAAPKAIRRPWRLLAAAIVAVIIAAAGYWALDRGYRPSGFMAASLERMAYPLPEEPSIAMIPLRNLSPDAGGGALVDALSESLVATLSELPGVFVIAPATSMQLRGVETDARSVAEQFGVRYILEGDFRRSGDEVRMSAAFIDVLAAEVLWSARYEYDFGHMSAIRGEVAVAVASALDIALAEDRRVALSRPPTENLSAWKIGLEAARPSWMERDREANEVARQHWLRAAQVDPDFAAALLNLGWSHWADARFSWVDTVSQSLREARRLANHVLELDPANVEAHALLGGAALLERDHDLALEHGLRSVALNPNYADGLALLATTQYFAGLPLDAETSIRRAIRLNPYHPPWYLVPLAEAYRLSGRLDEAITTIERQLAQSDGQDTRLRLALYYAKSGREDLARKTISSLLKENPNLTIHHWTNSQYFKDLEQATEDKVALLRAGLSENVDFDCLTRGECG